MHRLFYKKWIFAFTAMTMLIISCTAAAELPASVADALKRAGIAQSAVAVYVQAADSTTPSINHNAAKSTNPASVMKLVTEPDVRLAWIGNESNNTIRKTARNAEYRRLCDVCGDRNAKRPLLPHLALGQARLTVSLCVFCQIKVRGLNVAGLEERTFAAVKRRVISRTMARTSPTHETEFVEACRFCYRSKGLHASNSSARFSAIRDSSSRASALRTSSSSLRASSCSLKSSSLRSSPLATPT